MADELVKTESDPKAWTRDDFNRRQYKVVQSEDKELDKARRIGLKLTIDGRVFLDLQLREPGIFAIVSRPDDEEGFVVEIVGRNTKPGMGYRHSDLRAPNGGSIVLKIDEWMWKVLGL